MNDDEDIGVSIIADIETMPDDVETLIDINKSLISKIQIHNDFSERKIPNYFLQQLTLSYHQLASGVVLSRNEIVKLSGVYSSISSYLDREYLGK